MSHPQVTRPAISSSGGDWSRLPSFVSAPSLVLLAWTALQGATAQSLEFFSDATCANSIKKIDSVASLSCVDISDVGSFVGFTWGTDIGQIVFYNSDAAGGSCTDGSAENSLASINVGWVEGCHVVDSAQGGVSFQSLTYNKLDNTAATVAYVSTTAKAEPKPDPTTSPEDTETAENVVVTKHITKTTVVSPQATSKSSETKAEAARTTSKDDPTTSSKSSKTSTKSTSTLTSNSNSPKSTSRSSVSSTSSKRRLSSTSSAVAGKSSRFESQAELSSASDFEDNSDFSSSQDGEALSDTSDGASESSSPDDPNAQDSDSEGDDNSSSSHTVVIIASACGGAAFLAIILGYWCCCRSRPKTPFYPSGNEPFRGIRSWQSRLDEPLPPPPASSAGSQQAFFPLRSPGGQTSAWRSEGSLTSRQDRSERDGARGSMTRTSYLSYGRGTEIDEDGTTSHLEGATTILPSSSISQRGDDERPATTVVGSHKHWEAPMTMAGVDNPSQISYNKPAGSAIMSDLPRTVSRAPAPSSVTGYPQSPAGHQSLSASDFEKTTFVTGRGQPSTHSNWI